MAASVRQTPGAEGAPGRPPISGDGGDSGDGGHVNGVQSRMLLKALTSFKGGEFAVRLPSDWVGISGRIADTFNDCMELRQRLTRELERVSRVVGREGKLNQRANIGNVSGSGSWADSVNYVNGLIQDL